MKTKTGEGCNKVLRKDPENDLVDYAAAVGSAVNSQYQCRHCGMRFDTLEEHDRHNRRVHGQGSSLLLSGMTM